MAGRHLRSEKLSCKKFFFSPGGKVSGEQNLNVEVVVTSMSHSFPHRIFSRKSQSDDGDDAGDAKTRWKSAEKFAWIYFVFSSVISLLPMNSEMLCGKRERLKRSSRVDRAAEKFRNWFLASYQTKFSGYWQNYCSLFEFWRQFFPRNWKFGRIEFEASQSIQHASDIFSDCQWNLKSNFSIFSKLSLWTLMLPPVLSQKLSI